MTKPFFSFLMVNHNHGRDIGEAILSVVNQTYRDWELIIIDDASTDDSLEKIKPFLKDERIKLFINDRRLRVAACRHLSVTKAQADILGVIDSDDCLEPRAAEIMAEAHQKNKNGLIYSQLTICDANLKPLRGGKNCALLPETSNLERDSISHFVTFKKDSYQQTAGYDSFFNHGAEDKDLFYKLEEVTVPLFIDRPLYKYRQSKNSVSNNRRGQIRLRSRWLYLIAKWRAYQRRRAKGSDLKLTDILPGRIKRFLNILK